MGNNAPELDQKRSIDIITSAINDTRARMEVNTGAHMLLWGYTLTLTAAAAAIVTLHAATPATTMIWIAVPVAGIIGTRILSRRKPSDYPSNRILKALWWVVGIIAAVIFTLTAHFFTVALLLAVAAIVTGIITREKAVVAAGVAAALAATLFPIYKYLHPTAALFGTEDATPAIRVASYEAWFALTAAIMFIIPGHILHSRKSALTGNNNPQKKESPMNDNNTLTEQQSLELITRMISETRTRLVRNSGTPFLIWGYATVAVAIFEYFVQSTFTDPAPWLWAWWAIPVIGIVGMLLFHRRDTGAKNYLDRTVSAVWAVCSISILTVAVPLSLFYHVSMLFSVVVLIGIGTTITGRIIRDTTTTAAGFLFTLSALIYPLRSAFLGEIPSGAAADVIRWHSVNNLVFAAQFFVFMVIPGHILNRKTNRQCSGN